MFASSADWKASLNPAQLAAVTTGAGPVLVVAGAGTGKTWTLACRVAHLIEQGVPPERILLLTFSRRAAREMLSRAGRLVGDKGTGKVWGGTFHAIANRLLRLHGRPLGLSPDFTVLDQADMADLMDLIRGEQHPPRDKHERRFPRKDTLVAIYSRMVNAGAGLSTVLESTYPWCTEDIDGIRQIFAEYTRRKRSQNVLDYDDLLLYWRALGPTPGGREAARRFEHVLVDEYQDTNPLQAQILQSLRADNRNLMVVGDDAQSIYAFRAASIRNILDFPSQFPGTRRIMLEQNYRSTRPILDASNAVIAYARERFPKDLWPVRSGGARPALLTCADESEQSAQVCEQILEHREQGVPLRRQAVLFRTGHHSDLLELELTRRNIPFVKFGGLKFLESAHIKDVLSVLRVLENPRDEVSWFRVLQLLDGIGPAGARAIMRAIGVGGSARPNAATPAATVNHADSRLALDTASAAPIADQASAVPAATVTYGESRIAADTASAAPGVDTATAAWTGAKASVTAAAGRASASRAALPVPASDSVTATAAALPLPTRAPAADAGADRATLSASEPEAPADLRPSGSQDAPRPAAEDARASLAFVPSEDAARAAPAPAHGDALIGAVSFASHPAANSSPHPLAAADVSLHPGLAAGGVPYADSGKPHSGAPGATPPHASASLVLASANGSTPAAHGPAAGEDSPLLRLIADPPRVTEAAREPLDRLRQTLADCLADGATLPPSAEIARIRRFCEPIFLQRYSSPQARLHDIDQLEQVAGAHRSRSRFLSELALDPPTSTSDLAGPPLLDEDYLILSTVHSAKGGEWDVVHVIHAADGMIPSDMSTGDQEAIEEERRLFYVALTRARDNLYVYFSLRFYRRPRGLDDAHHFAQLTRFLPESVQSLFDRRTVGALPEPTLPDARRGNGQVEALLASLWEA